MNPPADGANYNHSDVDLNLSNVDRFPGLDCIDRMEAVLGPSDVLFNPRGCGTAFRTKRRRSACAAEFINIRTMISESPTLAFIRVFAARNPSLPEALHYAMLKKNLAQREKRLNTASIFRT